MKTTLILLAGLLLSGCASIISTFTDGHPNRKEIAVPEGATVTMLAGDVHKTEFNGIYKISRGAGPFRSNVGRIEKDGKMIAVVRRGFNGWTLGNIISWEFPGFIVDFAGGGAYNPQVHYLAVLEKTVIKE